MEVPTRSNSVRTLDDGQPTTRMSLKVLVVVLVVNMAYFAALWVFIGGPLLAGTVTSRLGGSAQTAWFGTIPNIIVVSTSIPLSQASDLWGRKWILVGTSGIAFVGAIVESRAQNIGTLLAGFCLLGLGVGNQSLLSAVVSEVVPRKQRPIAQAILNFSGQVGGIVALLVAGRLAGPEHPDGFRIYWYIVAATYALCTILCLIFYSPPPRELQVTLSLSEKLQQVDWVGCGLLPAALTLFCVALTWSRNPYEWASAQILAPFIISILLLGIFVLYESRIKRNGMLHHNLFSRNFVIAIIVLFCEGLSFFAGNTYISMEVSILYSLDLFDSALRFSITLYSGLVSTIAFGYYSTWKKELRWPMAIGCASLVLFNALMASINDSTPLEAFWGYPIFAGIGVGCLVSTTIACAQLSTPPPLIALASAIVISARSLGAGVGVAVNNAVFNSALEDKVPRKVADAVLPLGFPASDLGTLISALVSKDPDALSRVPGATPFIIEAGSLGVRQAYVIAFRNAWITAACIIFVSVIASIWVKNPREELSERIDAPVDGQSLELEGTRLDDVDCDISANVAKETTR